MTTADLTDAPRPVDPVTALAAMMYADEMFPPYPGVYSSGRLTLLTVEQTTITLAVDGSDVPLPAGGYLIRYEGGDAFIGEVTVQSIDSARQVFTEATGMQTP